MKVKHHIKTGDYTFVEFEEDYDFVEEAIAHSTQLQVEQKGLDAREWTQVRKDMLNTGECDVNLHERMSKAQAYFVNQLKLGMRSLTKE